MKRKLIIVLPLLLLILALEGSAPAGMRNNDSPAFSPDGVAVNNTQRRKRQRRRRSTAQRRRPRSYQVVMSPNEAASPEPVQEMPTMAAPPPPVSNPSMDAPKKSGAPRIKPPTVRIKPPTK
jgi:hypothetical protein